MKEKLARPVRSLALHAMVLSIWLLFKVMRLVDPNFRKAVASLDTTYSFRCGRSARVLSFSGGRVRTGRTAKGRGPDYEIVFIDLPGALRQMAKHPNDVLALMAQNKITRTGNDYYLFLIGYLFGLCESRLQAIFRLPHAARRSGHEGLA